MKSITSSFLMALAFTGSISPGYAQQSSQVDANDAQSMSHPVIKSQTGTSSAPSTEGEIKKIDKEAGKVTIKHGPLTNLGMPGMTMAFKVANVALLDQVKQGDKVNFVADKVNGQLTVTQMTVKH